jgi:hypothetical protein
MFIVLASSPYADPWRFPDALPFSTTNSSGRCHVGSASRLGGPLVWCAPPIDRRRPLGAPLDCRYAHRDRHLPDEVHEVVAPAVDGLERSSLVA